MIHWFDKATLCFLNEDWFFWFNPIRKQSSLVSRSLSNSKSRCVFWPSCCLLQQLPIYSPPFQHISSHMAISQPFSSRYWTHAHSAQKSCEISSSSWNIYHPPICVSLRMQSAVPSRGVPHTHSYAYETPGAPRKTRFHTEEAERWKWTQGVGAVSCWVSQTFAAFHIVAEKAWVISKILYAAFNKKSGEVSKVRKLFLLPFSIFTSLV